MFSSPSRGSYISTLSACDDSSDFFSFSSPSRGSYISTVNGVAYTLNATEAILVPFPGFLYLYLHLISKINGIMVLVPFPGFLYLYICEEFCERTGFEFSSPSRGSYISTIVIAIIILIVTVLVPFPGFLYLYAEKLRDAIAWERVLVPFPGFLYLYVAVERSIALFEVLVPFPGFLYLYRDTAHEREATKSSRPLPGVLISLRQIHRYSEQEFEFSSPSRGSYISTHMKNVQKL